jgi:hypothetical protein
VYAAGFPNVPRDQEDPERDEDERARSLSRVQTSSPPRPVREEVVKDAPAADKNAYTHAFQRTFVPS